MSFLTSNEATEYNGMEDVKMKPKGTVVHLKASLGDRFCAKCNADISQDGAFTYREEVYNNPLPGHTNCKSIWAE